MVDVSAKPHAEMVSRDAERLQIADFVAAIRSWPGALVLCGDAGIGKTMLWSLAIEHAAAAGIRVLVARCTETEMPIAFGALADVIGDAAIELGDELPGQQRDALAAAFGDGAAGQARPDWLVLARAVLATLRGLARQGSVLVAVDDVHWLDPASRRVLTYAFRRLADLPVGVISTIRDCEHAEGTLGLSESIPADRIHRLPVGPLGLGAIQHLIAARLGVHLPRPTAARVHRSSGGNPLFALEFARAATVGDAPTPGRVAPMSVPASLEQLVRARISQFDSTLLPLLQYVTLIERPSLPMLGEVLGDLVAAEGLVETAIRQNALTADADGVIRFAHPLLASGVYFAIGPARRRALHQHLAEIATDAEARGRHAALAATGPDAATADLVDQAAAAAVARCALDAAAELAAEAARLTPASDPAKRWRRLLTSAGWLADTGEFAAARSRLEPMLADGIPGAVRGEALLVRAECEFSDRRVLLRLLHDALAVSVHPLSRWHALIRLAHHGGWVSGDVQKASDTARQALDVARALDDSRLVEDSLAALAFYEAARGHHGALPVLAGSSRRDRPPRMQWWQISPAISHGCRLMWTGDLGQARHVLEGEYESLSRAGHETSAGFTLCWLSELEWRAGDWARAGELAQEATDILGDINPTAFPRALLAASKGLADEAHAIARGVLAWSDESDERVAPPRIHWLLGLLELSRGEPEQARQALGTALGLLDAAGIAEPGYVPVLPDLAESLVACGLLQEADAVAGRLQRCADSCPSNWAAMAALRTHALVSLGRGDTHAACAMSDDAAARFRDAGMPFEHARSLLLAGEARRRTGQRTEAAQRLNAAMQTFARLGAQSWLHRAEQEMRRASPRPRRDQSQLTAAESRVALLVAAGRTNREVASSLFTSVATVEAHLTRIYRKLGLRSRSELARRMAEGALAGEPREESGFP